MKAPTLYQAFLLSQQSNGIHIFLLIFHMRKQNYVSSKDLVQDCIVKKISRIETQFVCIQSWNSTYHPTSPKPHTTFFPALHRSQNAFVHSPILVMQWYIKVEDFSDVIGPGLRTVALDHAFSNTGLCV